MNAFAAGTRSFSVAVGVTALLGALVVWGVGLVDDPSDAPSSVSPVLPQVEVTADDAPPTDDMLEDETDGPSTVDELVAELEAEGVTESFAVYLSRDPFQPVVVQEVAASGGTDSGTGTGTDTGTGTVTTSSTACSGSGDEAVCEGTVVTMTGFTGSGDALIEVDGVLYTVSTGMEFATSFRVERLDEPSGCAFLRYGDEAFTICTGATVLK